MDIINLDGGGNKPEKIKILSPTKKASVVPDADIHAVWDYWLSVMGSKRAVLDGKRMVLIGAAVHDYGVDGCKQAIDGCASSPFHMGQNSQQIKYNSVGLIFRNADKTEDFMARSNKRNAKEEFINE
jgi:hypothetical protein